MSETYHLCDLWEHTIATILKHDSKSKVRLMIRQWVKSNKLENFISIFNYTIDDYTSSCNLCYINGNGDTLHQIPLYELLKLRWYIQHLVDENENEDENPLSEQNWMRQTNWKFIKYVIHHKQSMTPEQLKKKPFKEVLKIGHDKLNTEKGESNEEEEESLTSSDMSEQDSESDTTADDIEESKPTEALQIHNVCNTTMHDENNSICEDDSSEDENSVIEIESHSENGEQDNVQEDKLIPTNFEVKVENR